LLNPSLSIKNDLATSNFDRLQTLIEQALSDEQSGTLLGGAQDLNDEAWDLAISARGLLEAARLMDARYHLVVTNVPYLARGKQEQSLRDYCDQHYPNAKNDLANVFLERCLELTLDDTGVVQIVMPQNWLFLPTYKAQREHLLKSVSWNLIARLGPGAFETISGEVVQVILLTQTNSNPGVRNVLREVDGSSPKFAVEKSDLLRIGAAILSLSQQGQLNNPDSIVGMEPSKASELLSYFADFSNGLQTGDYPRFGRNFWEMPRRENGWAWFQSTVRTICDFDGLDGLVLWEDGLGSLARGASSVIRGTAAWGKRGVAVSAMGALPITRYSGELYDDNVVVLTAKKPEYLASIWAYCSSGTYHDDVRKVDKALKVRSALLKVRFDLQHWQSVAANQYPNGLPKPYSDNPTQWLFHGNPLPAIDPLQVAVARLLGYVWPAETDASMELSDEAHTWISRSKLLSRHVDDDGIVCLQAVRGEQPAHERLLALLIEAWEMVTPGSWTPSVLDKLLAQADNTGKGLAVWLRDSFFEQHAKRFQHRPFIWHVWDGQKDGFGALVNAHKLDAKNLERLIHTYLGDWIRTQEAGVASGVDGAPLRLSAAQNLKVRLQAILEGEAPYDIFIRWKPLAEQPIGWNPDLNDGIRLNIRPFMTAEVLRHNKKPKLNITWDKDRGKDVESAPWFKVFNGERINDHHLTLAEKMAAQTKAGNV
jgi:hypothetical protein